MPFIHHEPYEQKKKCNHPEHNPPTMIVLPPGNHTYQCPVCGEKTHITVPEVTC